MIIIFYIHSVGCVYTSGLGIYVNVNCDDSFLLLDTPPPPLPPLASCCWLWLLLCAIGSFLLLFFIFHRLRRRRLFSIASLFWKRRVRTHGKLRFTATSFRLRKGILASTKYRKCNPSYFEYDFDYIFNNKERKSWSWYETRACRKVCCTSNLWSLPAVRFFVFVSFPFPLYAAGQQLFIFLSHFFYDEK